MADAAVCPHCQIPTNDLADFCHDLERIGVKFERGKTRTGWYVKAGGGCFFFEAQGKARAEDVDREVYTRPAGTITIPSGYTSPVDYEAPLTFGVLTRQPQPVYSPPSDLDAFTERPPLPFTEENLATVRAGTSSTELVVPPSLEARARQVVASAGMLLDVVVDPELPADRWRLRANQMVSQAARLFQQRLNAERLGPELLAALRKVTVQLRSIVHSECDDIAGVLEAEALIERIDGGTP